MEIVDEKGNRYPVDIDTLNLVYEGDLEVYVQDDIVPQFGWWVE